MKHFFTFSRFRICLEYLVCLEDFFSKLLGVLCVLNRFSKVAIKGNDDRMSK